MDIPGSPFVGSSFKLNSLNSGLSAPLRMHYELCKNTHQLSEFLWMLFCTRDWRQGQYTDLPLRYIPSTFFTWRQDHTISPRRFSNFYISFISLLSSSKYRCVLPCLAKLSVYLHRSKQMWKALMLHTST